MKHQVDLRTVQVGIQLIENIWLVAYMIAPGSDFVPHLGRRPSFSIYFLVYLSLFYQFSSQGICFGLCIFGVSPK
jgi:hypothetical protein